MEKFEKLFAEYPCTLTDELVKKNAAEILEKHDDVDFNGEYPLTIGQARKSFNKKIKCKNE